MKATLFAVLFLPCLAPAQSYDVSLIQTRIGKPLGDDVGFEVKPMGHEAGVAFSFLVRGEDLVAFKDDSVEIKSFKLGDGREWARTRSGKPNWKQESFSKVGEDGKIGSFTVSFPGDLFGSVEQSTLDGSIKAVTAAASEEKKVTLAGDETAPKDLGPFKIGVAGGGGFFGGGKDSTNIQITGDHQAIIEVVVMDGEAELDGNGSSWSGDRKTYHFAKAKGKELAVTVRYWSDLKEITIPFAIAPPKK
ncbi:hypothetical protein [Luteolibacter marinus]|uniref:hypothetical protein n=1 Tax=Luteolibacter marinus TaxID=2776705 RepID=UPI001867186B|nr:hypothetical protein [Luteolibacter marinus]